MYNGPAMRKLLLPVLAVICLAPFSASASDAPCLKYEPEVVKLAGTMKRVVFPGPPNYESVKGGDAPETYYVLFLEQAVCVQGDPRSQTNSETESGVKSLQLMGIDYKKARRLLGKPVVAEGTLMHSETGHHHTAVLLQVKSLAKQAKTARARTPKP